MFSPLEQRMDVEGAEGAEGPGSDDKCIDALVKRCCRVENSCTRSPEGFSSSTIRVENAPDDVAFRSGAGT
jgi:hypothetical protein